MMKSLFLLLCIPALALAFCPPQQQVPLTRALQAVKFDKKENKFVTSNPATEGPEAGYDIWGTIIRGGPLPFFTRLFNPDTYEQAVLKYMVSDKVGRLEAQANMDKYLENPNDWTYFRLQGMKPDYVTVDQKALNLRIAWSSVVVGGLLRTAYSLATGEPFLPK
jgi:hypothetical protein